MSAHAMLSPSRIALAPLIAAILIPLAHAGDRQQSLPPAGAELSDWLDVSGTHRTRYETLDGQFRAGRSGGDQMLAFRTNLRLEAKFAVFSVVGEMMDSRQSLADSGTPLDTTMVNAVELLQGYAAVRLDGAFVDDSRSEIRIGRAALLSY